MDRHDRLVRRHVLLVEEAERWVISVHTTTRVTPFRMPPMLRRFMFGPIVDGGQAMQKCAGRRPRSRISARFPDPAVRREKYLALARTLADRRGLPTSARAHRRARQTGEKNRSRGLDRQFFKARSAAAVSTTSTAANARMATSRKTLSAYTIGFPRPAEATCPLPIRVQIAVLRRS